MRSALSAAIFFAMHFFFSIFSTVSPVLESTSDFEIERRVMKKIKLETVGTRGRMPVSENVSASPRRAADKKGNKCQQTRVHHSAILRQQIKVFKAF
jgi:hypothetical protein